MAESLERNREVSALKAKIGKDALVAIAGIGLALSGGMMLEFTAQSDREAKVEETRVVQEQFPAIAAIDPAALKVMVNDMLVERARREQFSSQDKAIGSVALLLGIGVAGTSLLNIRNNFTERNRNDK